MTIAALDKKV